jgi:hypothetical protein
MRARLIRALDVHKGGTCLMSQCGCDKCWSSDASKAWKAVTSIPIEEYLIDESHYIVSIRSCPACSQRYLQVTTETVDWKDGEDPIFRTIIPIDDEERASLIANSPPKTSVLEAISPGSAHSSTPGKREKNQARTGVPGFRLASTTRVRLTLRSTGRLLASLLWLWSRKSCEDCPLWGEILIK